MKAEPVPECVRIFSLTAPTAEEGAAPSATTVRGMRGSGRCWRADRSSCAGRAGSRTSAPSGSSACSGAGPATRTRARYAHKPLAGARRGAALGGGGPLTRRGSALQNPTRRSPSAFAGRTTWLAAPGDGTNDAIGSHSQAVGRAATWRRRGTQGATWQRDAPRRAAGVPRQRARATMEDDLAGDEFAYSQSQLNYGSQPSQALRDRPPHALPPRHRPRLCHAAVRRRSTLRLRATARRKRRCAARATHVKRTYG